MPNASEVTVCSNALQRLGANGISSFDDPSKFAGVCAGLWPRVRNSLLRSHPWNCATKRVILSPLLDKPPFDYGYQFQLPGDCLRVIQVGRRGYMPDYQKEGQRILAHIGELPLVYIWRNEAVETWDDMLVEVAVQQMMAVLAYPVTASTSLKQSEEQTALFALKQAKAADGQDNPPEEFEPSELARARFRG